METSGLLTTSIRYTPAGVKEATEMDKVEFWTDMSERLEGVTARLSPPGRLAGKMGRVERSTQFRPPQENPRISARDSREVPLPAVPCAKLNVL